ncbi:MAG: hypothetical protein V1703_04770 [Candidatus Altiarchaeota archaeon]
MDDVTAFAAYSLDFKPNPQLLVKALQACAIMKDDQHVVRSEMERMNAASPLVHFQTRIKSMDDWCIPWAYPNRLLLFGSVAVWLARRFGVDSIRISPVFDEESRPSTNYAKLSSFMERNPHEGIKITGYL